MDTIKRIPYFGAQALLLYMPFHVFLSQSLSLVTGGLEAWKVGKDIALFLLVMFSICLVFWQGKANRFFKALLIITTIYAIFHLATWVFNPDIYQKSAILGTVYNMRLSCFAILGAGACLLVPKFAFSSLIKIVLGASTLVALLGIIQYFLPSDVLTHVGYGLDRGARATFSIDNNPLFPRIMSTLREPNALAAYLLLPVMLLTGLLFRIKDARRFVLIGSLGLHVLAILLTQSRSGWIGLVVGLALLLIWQYRTQLMDVGKRYWYIPLIGIVLAFPAMIYVKDTAFFQSYIIHSDTSETVTDLDSNDYHLLLIREGLEGIQERPFGHGPGTAGLVSIQNPDGGQLTENYYVQIAYELGIAGCVVFLMLNVWLYRRLWRRGDYIGMALCASFWGYVVTNMLLHTWSNETVAAQWWILAGISAVAAIRQAPPKRT